jgi:hypothetical protein
MVTIEVRAALSEEELSDRLRKFFGKDGLELGVKVDCPSRLIFEGGWGHVSATFWGGQVSMKPPYRHREMPGPSITSPLRGLCCKRQNFFI